MGSAERFRPFRILERLEQLTLPTLVVWGRDDKGGSLDSATVAIQRMPNARLVTFDACGHYPMIEHPEVVAERIERWANAAGKENILVGNDCGFASVAGNTEIQMTVAWAKLASLGEGARIASKRLWN